MARPRAGDWLTSELDDWRSAGIESVVCLLQPDEIDELSLGDEAELCRVANIEFVSYPIADRGVPDDENSLAQLVRRLAADLKRGRSVAIHCRAGIGRSAVVAACVMHALGVQPDTALRQLSEARGVRVPDTEQQRIWINRFCGSTP
jgi:protein-tyrosine phosphatase